MSANISFTIDDDLLEAAGTVVPGEKSPLSLLKGNGSTATGEQAARLKSAGVVDAADKAKAEYIPVLETLARTRMAVTLQFSAGSRLFEMAVAFPGKGNGSAASVSLVHDSRKVVVNAPAAAEDVFRMIDENVGHSRMTSSDFAGTFRADEAIALFALMDLQRSVVLRALADEMTPKETSFDLAIVKARITGGKEGYQSLSSVGQAMLGLSSATAAGKAESGLKSLADRKLVVGDGGKYRLAEALKHLAGRIPVIDSFVKVTVGKLDESDRLVYGSFLSLQAGVNDILYVERHGDELDVKAISGMQLSRLIAMSLTEPDFIQPPAAGTSEEKKFCIGCGATVKANDRFCPACGKKV